MTPSDAESKLVSFRNVEELKDVLPFRVELWDWRRDRPERIIGRAATMVLAQAIFSAAQADFSGERITLSRDGQILMDTQ